MLVLQRKCGERIQIGDNVVLTVLEVHRGRVRIGIEAGPEVSVVRQECLLRRASKNLSAMDSEAKDGELMTTSAQEK